MVGNVESVKFIKHITGDIDFCEITVDFDTHKIFYNWNKLNEFIGACVEYSVRQDMFEGQLITVIVNLAETKVINTITKTESVKLIPDESRKRAICNFAISDIKFGDVLTGCIAFLAGYDMGSSNKAQWIDCKMVDKNSKIFNLRLFYRGNQAEDITSEDAIEAKVGCYVKFDLISTNYGYQTDLIALESTNVTLPPEVEVAISIINDAVKNDEKLKAYMTKHDYCNRLSTLLNGEMGYDLVYVAAEILQIQALSNISDYYDIPLMIRTAITSRGYLLPCKTKFSKPVLNTSKVINSELATDRDLLLMLDPLATEEITPTKRVYMKLAGFTKEVIDERRYEVVQECPINIFELSKLSGGLLC